MNIFIEQEMALHQVWFNTDKSVVERLLHSEFTEVAESGRSHNFKDMMAFMDSDKHLEDHVHSQDYEVVQLESNTVLLLYRSALLKPTGIYVSFAKRSSIWIKSDEKWKMKYHQGTLCEAFKIIY